MHKCLQQSHKSTSKQKCMNSNYYKYYEHCYHCTNSTINICGQYHHEHWKNSLFLESIHSKPHQFLLHFMSGGGGGGGTVLNPQCIFRLWPLLHHCAGVLGNKPIKKYSYIFWYHNWPWLTKKLKPVVYIHGALTNIARQQSCISHNVLFLLNDHGTVLWITSARLESWLLLTSSFKLFQGCTCAGCGRVYVPCIYMHARWVTAGNSAFVVEFVWGLSSVN